MLMFEMSRNPGQSWGIRIGGGQDRGRALVLEKVTHRLTDWECRG